MLKNTVAELLDPEALAVIEEARSGVEMEE